MFNPMLSFQTGKRFAVMVGLASLLLASASAAADDVEPPKITHKAITRTTADEALVIRATIEDAAGIFDPTVVYRVGSASSFQRAQMVAVPGSENSFVATIPGELLGEGVTSLSYFIEAYDNNGNGPTTFGDESNPMSVKVETSAPDEGNDRGKTGGKTGGKTSGGAGSNGAGADGTKGTEVGGGKVTKNPTKGAVVDDESEGGGFGLWLGVGAGVVGAVVVVAAIAAAGVGAYFYFTRADTLDEVTLQVSGPSPVAVP